MTQPPEHEHGITPHQPEEQDSTAEREYRDLVDRGWLGSAISQEKLTDEYSQLHHGLIRVLEISNLQVPVPTDITDDFEKKLIAYDLLELARQHHVIGLAVQPIHVFWSPDLFAGIVSCLQDLGVDLSEFGISGRPQLPPAE